MNITIDSVTYELVRRGTEAHVVANNYQGEVTIPSHISPDGVRSIPVVAIEDRAFYKCEELTAVTLPEGLQEIGDFSFAYCTSLTEIRIPNSVCRLGYGAFAFCDNILHMDLPQEVPYIPRSFLFGCNHQLELDIPNSVQWIGDMAFYKLDLDLKPTERVQYMGNVLCDGRLLQAENGVLRIKEGTRYIANRAFEYNETLTQVILPSSVVSIGEKAFAECKNLRSVQLAEGLEKIGVEAFAQCSALEKIYIPNSVKTIGAAAFTECTGLREMVVGEQNKHYDSRCNCNGIIQKKWNMLVAACPSTVILDVLEIIGDKAFKGVYQSSELVLPKSVKCIGNDAFGDNDSLQRVVIHDEMEVIGCFAFQGCGALSEIELPKKYVEIGENAFMDTACVENQSPGAAYVGNHLCKYIPYTEDGPEPDCVIPEGIEYIDLCAFYFVPSMRIFFPRSLKAVDIGAFILDESDHELIAPEGMGDDYPVKNGCIQYQSDMNTKWWDRLNEGWRQ